MAETKIEWANYTFNPWRGCTKVSPGCAHCYAETMSKRNPSVLGEWGPDGTRVVASESYWRQPCKWDREAKAAGERRRVFCASLADVFEDRPDLDAPRKRLFDLITDTEHLDWLLLTKRPENVERLMRRVEGWALSNAWDEWVCYPDNLYNVWLGVSVEDQARADERIPLLLKTPAAVRFLSVEPLLGPVDLRLQEHVGPHVPDDDYRESDWIHWVIIGGESGPRARPCAVEWVRSLVGQCRQAGVACFVKQLGAYPAYTTYEGRPAVPVERPYFYRCADGPVGPQKNITLAGARDKKGGDPDEWPEDLRVREFPNSEDHHV